MPTSEPAVAILPYERRLGYRPGQIALDDLIWPLGQPERLKGQRLRDLAPKDHLILYPHRSLHWRPGFGTKAKVSIMVLEPAAIHGHHLSRLRRTHRRFHRVLSHHDPLLGAIPNGVFFPAADSWVANPSELVIDKTAMCSIIASPKRTQPGHVLRHDMVDWIKDTGAEVDLLGRAYKPFVDKADGLAPYRYSLIIENVQERNHFTEKLMDALFCETIPIYWGCPNIHDFFDQEAIIACPDAEALKTAITRMSPGDYAARLPVLRAQKARAADLADLHRRAAEAVLDQTS